MRRRPGANDRNCRQVISSQLPPCRQTLPLSSTLGATGTGGNGGVAFTSFEWTELNGDAP